MFHKHGVYDTDLHFIIDPITRDISSESGKVRLMQLDHNSERFTFELPRYIEEHDMTLCNVVEVHYINLGKEITKPESIDIYPVLDLQPDPEDDTIAIGSWLVSQNATRYYGDLKFDIRFACVEEDGEITYQWFTNKYDLIDIEQTIFNTETVVEDIGPDGFNVWKEDVYNMASKLVDEAEIHANNAKDSENNARISEMNAASHMQAAAKSEANAKLSEQNAAASEAAAKKAEENASKSEEAAEKAAEELVGYAQVSKSYAVGDTGTRVGEDTDNSKYYSEVAQNLYNESLTTLDQCEETLVDLNARAIGVQFVVNFETGNLEYISPYYYFSVNTETGNLEWSTDAPSPDTIHAATATSEEIVEMLDEVFAV